MRIFLHGCVLVMMAGCTGDLVELNATRDQGTGGGPPDMAQAGGGEMGPSNLKFYPDIQNDIDTVEGCSAVGCHGGTQIPVLKMGATAANDQGNYAAFINDVNTGAPDQSLVLTKNLPGASHGGGAKFSGTQDVVYQRWLGWIQAGAPKQ
jgi:hypothetical protein